MGEVAVAIATCAITFAYNTFHLYTKMVFRNRQEVVATFLAMSTYIVYTVSLIQIIWYSYNWYSGVGDDPMMFGQLVVADFAVFSIITKRKESYSTKAKSNYGNYSRPNLSLLSTFLSTCVLWTEILRGCFKHCVKLFRLWSFMGHSFIF